VKNSIRELRAERAWSQADLGREADVSRQTINAIETGKYDPSLPLAFKLAEIFGRRIEDLFDPNGEGASEFPRQ
jgi:putative transcriptional regulator